VSSGATARDLDRSLDRLLAGETPSGGGMSGGELAAARWLRSLPRPQAEAPARSLARDLLLAEADGRRARWVHSHHVPAVAPPPPKKGIRLGQLTLLLLALLIAVTVGVVVAAAADFSTPDSSLYTVKRAGENMLLRLSRDPVSRSDLEVNLAEERLREAETMAAVGKPDLALQALATRYSELRDAGDRLAAPQARNARWTDARDRYLDEAGKPVLPLERELSQKGYPSWAKQATDMASGFQKYLEQLRPRLGVKAGGGAPPPTQPSPPATPGATGG
jgi:hypothetical protein